MYSLVTFLAPQQMSLSKMRRRHDEVCCHLKMTLVPIVYKGRFSGKPTSLINFTSHLASYRQAFVNDSSNVCALTSTKEHHNFLCTDILSFYEASRRDKESPKIFCEFLLREGF